MADVNRKIVCGGVFIAVMAFLLGLGAYHTIIRPFQKPKIEVREVEKIVYRDVKPELTDEVPNWVDPDPAPEYETTPIIVNRFVTLDTTFSDVGRLYTVFDMRTLTYPVVSFEPFPIELPVRYQKVFLPRGFFRSREFGFIVGVALFFGTYFMASG